MAVGRISTGVLVVVGCLVAPRIAEFEGVFKYIQMVWGFISPGIVTVFVFGLIARRAPLSAALTAMLAGIPIYGGLLYFYPRIAFLNHMAITFVILASIMAVITWIKPLPRPVTFPTRIDLDLTPSRSAPWLGAVVILLTLALYLYFR